ncbi:hypothetical protein C8J56DRAFT_1053511 [Mycena floridula]|nr:hypothetical protein C8J56DRAFT_1053511 [Mycena floridula]
MGRKEEVARIMKATLSDGFLEQFAKFREECPDFVIHASMDPVNIIYVQSSLMRHWSLPDSAPGTLAQNRPKGDIDNDSSDPKDHHRCLTNPEPTNGDGAHRYFKGQNNILITTSIYVVKLRAWKPVIMTYRKQFGPDYKDLEGLSKHNRPAPLSSPHQTSNAPASQSGAPGTSEAAHDAPTKKDNDKDDNDNDIFDHGQLHVPSMPSNATELINLNNPSLPLKILEGSIETRNDSKKDVAAACGQALLRYSTESN